MNYIIKTLLLLACLTPINLYAQAVLTSTSSAEDQINNLHPAPLNTHYTALEPLVLEAFIDGSAKTAMEDQHLPGFTVSVVQNGKLIFAKGYGLARTDPPQPVVADKTLFRIGSISKTFTFTGIMQLLEQGKLDLSADIEPLMGDVKVEGKAKYGPISMVDLMTHSAGFEDAYIGFFYAEELAGDMAPTQILNGYAPHRVRPVGEQIVYSNYGVDLAGKVLESLSGQSIADYADAHIFKPLGMLHSSFRDYPNQEAPGYLRPELEKNRAIGYRWAGGAYQPYDKFFMHRGQYAAGSVSATATDMALFMLAHLNGGSINGKRILNEDTTALMHTRLRSNAEGIAGNAHGFWNNTLNGYETIEHGGAVLGFLSDMVLIPELQLGIFTSTNGDSGRNFVTALPRRIMDHFYPGTDSKLAPVADFSQNAAVYSGQFMSNRRGYKIIDKLASLDSEVTVSVTADGYLITSSAQGSKRWLPVNDRVFENIDDGSRMAFKLDKGKAVQMFSAYGHNVADRISFYQSSRFFQQVAALTLILCLGSLSGFWLRRSRQIRQSRSEKIAAICLFLAAISWLVLFACVVITFSSAAAVSPEILVHYPSGVAWLMHSFGIIATAFSIISAILLIPVWQQAHWPFWRRLRHSLIVITMLVMVWLINNWNILGFRYLGN